MHRLSEVDDEAKTAWCGGCSARVEVTRSGKGWICAPNNRRKAAEWRKEHPEREAASKAAYESAHPELVQEQRKGTRERYYAKNRTAIIERARQATADLRAEVIAAYGGHCACPGCHVHHAELLTIDHVNGGGNEHRRSIGRGSKDFYRWLKRNGYPAEFQALCGSCNLAKSDRDKCPLAGEDH